MNNINKIRGEIKEFFYSKRLVQGSEEVCESPNGNYRLETSNYLQDKVDVNWNVTKVEIYDNKSQEKIFDFFGNDGRFFYEWINKDGIDLLICAEDLFGGQTVIDLTNRKMESFSPNENGFIWTNFHLSPDSKILATVGCYWGCPYIIKFYDFQNPLILPLPELNEIELLDANEVVIGWLDNDTLKTKVVKRENRIENYDNGSFRMKTINETLTERTIMYKKTNQ